MKWAVLIIGGPNDSEAVYLFSSRENAETWSDWLLKNLEQVHDVRIVKILRAQDLEIPDGMRRIPIRPR